MLLYQNSISFRGPLDVIYIDGWSSPTLSYDGYKYYILLVDHFTKYMWYYPLKKKSYSKDVFIQFNLKLKKCFQRSIVTIFGDNGEEYNRLDPFFASHGIILLTSLTHTPEYNGYSEKHHRRIVNTRLTLNSCFYGSQILDIKVSYCSPSSKLSQITKFWMPLLLVVASIYL